MPDSKWITGLSSTTPTADAARQALTVRLGAVCSHLERAIDESDRDPECVHQLRVSTRRAGAALHLFEGCLPAKVHRKTRRQLQRIRRAAGEARDWDVFLSALSAEIADAESAWQPGFEFLQGYAFAERAAAQGSLLETVSLSTGRVERLTAKAIKAVRPLEKTPRLGDLAQPVLLGLLHELVEAASGNLEDYQHLHRVRIIGKRLRYAMELFADCYAPAFRTTLYPAVETMQEILGNANDSHVAAGRLSAIREALQESRPGDWQRLRPGIEGLLHRHELRLPEERERFVAWWQTWCDLEPEAKFAEVLHD